MTARQQSPSQANATATHDSEPSNNTRMPHYLLNELPEGDPA